MKCPGCGKHVPSECDWCSDLYERPRNLQRGFSTQGIGRLLFIGRMGPKTPQSAKDVNTLDVLQERVD